MIPLSFVEFWKLFLGTCHCVSRTLVWLADFSKCSGIYPLQLPTHGLCPASVTAHLVTQNLLLHSYSDMSVSWGSQVRQGREREEGPHSKALMKAVEFQDRQSVSWVPWSQLCSLSLKNRRTHGVNTNLNVGIVKTTKIDVQSNSKGRRK